MEKMKTYQITYSDNETEIVTEAELNELIEECMEFDGFLGFTYKEIDEN